MPELPEMETYRMLLTNRITGLTITDVRIDREKSINVTPERFKERVANRQILAIGRRAKHLLFDLDSGDTLLLHLMLGGWMFYGTEEQKPDRTVQVRLTFNGYHLFFIGLRLGYLHLHTMAEAQRQLAGFGPEPFDPGLTAAAFVRLFKSRRGILKAQFMDQHFIAGIGSCYSDEICYAASVSPLRNLSGLSEEELLRLYTAMQSVLREAAGKGGYMEEPLFAGDRLTGGFNDLCKVYDREGEICLRCGGTILLKMIASRKCFYCPQCQH